ncbi:MAG: hypothetical protein QXU99_02300 [Candidatus Bathyarchaeia archaeon]
MPVLKPMHVTLIAMNAALYATVGLVVYFIFPIVAPTVGGVRFWPVVVIPATFALLFGGIVGGVGAAIGIFISDILIHGDPLLSITVGVPANFIAFWIMGYLSRKQLNWKRTLLSLSIGVTIIATLAYLVITPESVINYFNVRRPEEAFFNISVVVAIFVISYLIAIIVGYVRPQWRSFEVASVVGTTIGSAIIGIGVWAYTQLFTLPAAIGGATNLPYYAGLILFSWTFATEIPFLVVMVPPIAEACYKAFPALKLQLKIEKKGK